MKFTPSLVIDAPGYYVDHFHARHDVDKCVILRDKQLESDSDSMPASLRHLTKTTHILDLTNNELKELPNLRDHHNIHTLLLARNEIKHFNGKRLPGRLQNLVLATNGISSVSQLKGLHHAPRTLRNLSLRGNPICHLQNYRLHVLKILPTLQVLDFQNITKEERKAAKAAPVLHKGSQPIENVQAEDSIEKRKRQDKNMELMNFVVSKMSPEKKEEIKQKLANATSLDEILKLEKLLSGA